MALLLALAGLASAVVLAAAIGALARRRSWSYLLVTLAIATLLARTGVAAMTMAGGVESTRHHVVEHGLDVVMAGLVIAAVYYARRVAPSMEGSHE